MFYQIEKMLLQQKYNTFWIVTTLMLWPSYGLLKRGHVFTVKIAYIFLPPSLWPSYIHNLRKFYRPTMPRSLSYTLQKIELKYLSKIQTTLLYHAHYNHFIVMSD
mgnify:CR=1 FL=1